MNKKMKLSAGDKVFYAINGLIVTVLFLIVLFPIMHVVSSSLSAPEFVNTGKVGILPKGISFDAYSQVLNSDAIVTGYKNSIIYTVVGTTINVALTLMAAYPLSRKEFVGRNFFSILFVVTMIFTAPLIPTYLNVRNLKLLDSIWAMVLPGAISTYNMIIARTFFQNSIPDEMIEAGRIDGASDLKIFVQLVLPVSKAIVAVLVLYYAIAHWNTYFNAFIYLQSNSKFPLQVVLRNIMSTAQSLSDMVTLSVAEDKRRALIEVMKYAIIVVGSLPVIALYPFVQKHFVKGVMIGSVKG